MLRKTIYLSGQVEIAATTFLIGSAAMNEV